MLKHDGEVLNENQFLLTSLTKACRFQNDRVKTRLPIRKKLLSIMLLKIHTVVGDNQPYLISLYRAMLSTAYFGLFHICEIAKSPENDHVIKAKDVHVGRNKKKMMFLLHTSKTHWTDCKPQVVKIHSTDFNCVGKRFKEKKTNKNGLDFCPFALLNDYINVRNARQSNDEQFFVFHDNSPVSTYNFRVILKDTLEKMGLDPTLYTGHSIRAGRTVDLVDLNFSVETVKKLGRWTSNAVYTYMKFL